MSAGYHDFVEFYILREILFKEPLLCALGYNFRVCHVKNSQNADDNIVIHSTLAQSTGCIIKFSTLKNVTIVS